MRLSPYSSPLSAGQGRLPATVASRVHEALRIQLNNTHAVSLSGGIQ